jgi:hypothetical protein
MEQAVETGGKQVDGRPIKPARPRKIERSLRRPDRERPSGTAQGDARRPPGGGHCIAIARSGSSQKSRQSAHEPGNTESSGSSR